MPPKSATVPGSLLSALTALLLTAGCAPERTRPTLEEGVRLLVAEPLAATAQFELRFEDVVTTEDDVGTVAEPAPLRVTPPLAGRFTWRSQRSGVFIPNAPLALNTEYRFALSPAWVRTRAANGTLRLERTLRTPPLQLVRVHPPGSHDTNAPAWPELELDFNAPVPANHAAAFLEFEDGLGRRWPARVRQGEVPTGPASRYSNPASPTWWGELPEEPASEFDAGPGAHDAEGSPAAADRAAVPIANRLHVTPVEPLPVAPGWRLVLRAGLPSAQREARLPEPQRIALGDVQPFRFLRAAAENELDARRRLRLEFSRRLAATVAATNVLDWVSVTPAPTDLEVQVAGRFVIFQGDFALDTDYLVACRAGLPAADGTRLAPAAAEHRVRFEPLAPRLYFPAFATAQLEQGRRVLPLRALNVDQIRVRARLLEPGTLVHTLRAYKSYFRRWDDPDAGDAPFKALDFNAIPGRQLPERQVNGRGAVDRPKELELEWDRLLAGRAHGAVFLEAEAELPGRERRVGAQALVQLTDLALVWKRAGTNAWVWVFSHATGQPVTGARVRVSTEDNETLAQGETDTEGRVELPLAADAVWWVAERGDDVHAVALEDWSAYVGLYRFPILHREWEAPQAAPHEVALFTDRPFYRPGETLHVKAVARTRTPAGWTLPTGQAARLDVFDRRGEPWFGTNLVWSDFGSAALSLPLPRAPLGEYRVQIECAGQTWDHRVLLADFQPNAFEIRFPPGAASLSPTNWTVPIQARYLFGKPLARAQARWSLLLEDAPFEPPGWTGFVFGDDTDFDGEARPARRATLQGEVPLAEDGTARVSIDLPHDPARLRPRTLSLDVTITDVNQQTLVGRLEAMQTLTDFHLGLRQETQLVAAGAAWSPRVVAVRPTGEPLPARLPVQVTVERIEYQPVPLETAGGGVGFHPERRRIAVAECATHTCPVRRQGTQWQVEDQPGDTPSVILPEPGAYLLTARAQDEAGREVTTRSFLYVSGPRELAWEYRNLAQLDLVADRASYRPGDTATLLVKTPIAGTALVTVERDGVERSFTTSLAGNAPVIRVPLRADDAPNTFVSVLMLRGSADSRLSLPRPEGRVGYCQLTVERPETRLALALETDAARYLPRRSVAVTLTAQEATGRPVAEAEVTLFAVDEGVLQLGDAPGPDLHAHFHAPRPLRVRTGSSLPALLPEDPALLEYGNKGYVIGGGGRAGGLRQRFEACAFWNATLRTDAEGRVRVSFPAPDNVTRFRVMAVAQTRAHQFGRAETSFEVAKPLLIEAALPPLARLGDRLRARAVVHNSTPAPMEVEAGLELDARAAYVAEGDRAATAPAGPRRFTVPGGGSVPVEFTVRLQALGDAVWTWRAHPVQPWPEDAEFADAVQVKLAVLPRAQARREVRSLRIDTAEADLGRTLDPELWAGSGQVTVRLATSRLIELAEGVQQLLTYPYGCVEQTSSSLIPWLAAADLGEAFPLPGVTTARVQDAIRRGVERLCSMQTDGGGLAYWPRGQEPTFWGSAYGALVLAWMRQQGQPVPEAPFERLRQYLSQALRGTDLRAEGGFAAGQALWALALAGAAEPAYHATLFEQRAGLAPDARALLACAIAEAGGPLDMARELLRAAPDARACERDWFGSPARTHAVRLQAWTRVAPDSDTARTLAEDLWKSQTNGQWITTQGNAWAIKALTAGLPKLEGSLPAASLHLDYGTNTTQLELARPRRWAEVTWSLSGRGSDALRLRNPARVPVYAHVTLEAQPPPQSLGARDRGVRVTRRYERLEAHGTVAPLAEPRVGDTVVVTLTSEFDRPARHVAIDDPLPAVFEAMHPAFRSRQTQAAPGHEREEYGDFRELRADRALFFRDYQPAGRWTVRYLARIRAAGTAIAPSTKTELMYAPDRYGLAEPLEVTTHPFDTATP